MDSNSLVFALACNVTLGIFLGALLCKLTSGFSVRLGPAGMQKSLIYTGLVLFFYSCLAGIYINGEDTASLVSFPLFFILGYVLCARNAVPLARSRIGKVIALCEKLAADDGELFERLDCDRDGVISGWDLEQATPNLIGRFLSSEELMVLDASFEFIGHCIDEAEENHIITRSDLATLIERVHERFKLWM